MYGGIDTRASVPNLEREPHLLIVDDNDVFRERMRRSLEPWGSVTWESTAAAALKRIESGEVFEMIICEVRLPGMDGIEFLTALSERAPEQGGRTVLMAEGAMDNETVRKAWRFGVPLVDKSIDRRFFQKIATWYLS